ncbi:hypothetical protein Nepgr_018861 [Nepenthes gracilis]|uniref:Uncharacterized protein n=1 Tax=Nepenthes gracilis TaxID=150966 RepID=A0AAD3SU81_NEPGR|nr:hypothetical protein Nepgr_018861 [Nepenthes gracilis]
MYEAEKAGKTLLKSRVGNGERIFLSFWHVQLNSFAVIFFLGAVYRDLIPSCPACIAPSRAKALYAPATNGRSWLQWP